MDKILGIGIDLVSIKRFKHWINYKEKQLLKIFSPAEIEYAQSSARYTAERFAVRFAAKEAFFKALGQAYPQYNFSLFAIAQHTFIIKNAQGVPTLDINWHKITPDRKPLNTKISLSHDTCHAIAIVIIG